MKKLLPLLVIGIFISFSSFAQCDFTFNPAGNVYDPGDDVEITICFQDYTAGFPTYEAADWDADNDGNWDIVIVGDNGGTITYTATGSGYNENKAFCVIVEFIAGSAGTTISITPTATGTINSCTKTSTQNYTLIPIEYESISVKKDNNIANIDWVTLSEINNDFFTVEMSLDGENFKNLGDVKGAGNSRNRVEYDFSYIMDENVLHTSFVYFRLKQTDFDGLFTYSDVMLLSNDTDKSFFALNNAYYNNSNIHFEISSMDAGTVQTRVTNLNGHTIYNQTLYISEGINSMDIPVDNSYSGLYILQVINNNKMETKKIFIN